MKTNAGSIPNASAREFEGKRVVVTGAGRGIGFHVARLALRAGARVAVLAQHEESARAAADALRELGEVVSGFGDLASYVSCQRVITQAIDALGGVDVLVNNAGWTLTSPFLREEPAYWERVMAVNLWPVIWASRHVLDVLVPQKLGGSIVNVASDAGRVGMQGEAVYAAAKGGVIAFSKSLAQEMARHQIRVNVVSPGPTNTRVLEENLAGPDQAGRIERMIQRIPLKRVAEPEEIAETVVFLAGPRASHITGQVLSVSGGLTMV